MFSHIVLGGEKEHWLVAFYGYGQSSAIYSGLYNKIRETHNMLIIDNPMWDYSQDIYPKDLQQYIAGQLRHYKIESFSSVSYSMGSRLNLYLPLFFPKRLRKIIIIAPDGITYNFWNRVAISTPWGRRIFKYFAENGKAYMNALLFFHRIGVVNKSMYAFSKWNMRDEDRRKSVYNAWMNMRFLRPDLNEVNEQVGQNQTELISFFGKRDPVIPLKVHERCKKMLSNGKHELIDADHNILSDKLFQRIKKELEK